MPRQVIEHSIERLPVCFCHHDAFRRNLMLRKTDAGANETVAIDWAFAGLGGVGVEAGVTTSNAIAFADFPSDQVSELDDAIFTGYVDGLHTAGWRGDECRVRLGYAISAALRMASACALFIRLVQTPEAFGQWAPTFKRSFEDYCEHIAQALPFFLDLGDEAYALAKAM